MRIVTTALVYLATLVGIGACAAFAALVLAGPHSDLLPRVLQFATLVLGWSAVLVLPVLAARWTWRQLSARRAGGAAGVRPQMFRNTAARGKSGRSGATRLPRWPGSSTRR